MSDTAGKLEGNDEVVDFETLGRLPMPGDNAAIATRDLPRGTRFRYCEAVHELSHAILEGHRFAVEPILPGGELLSWNLPFGRALRSIRPGEYLCNASVLDALRLRNPDSALPRVANFQNAGADFHLDEAGYRAGEQVPLHDRPGTFAGFPRTGGRGTGTRNVIVILGTTSETAAFARRLAASLKSEVAGLGNVDGIEAVTHTEGGAKAKPNNLELVLRTLAGFMVHPNVAAVLAVDSGSDFPDNAGLEEYMVSRAYPLRHVPHAFHTLRRDIDASLHECGDIVRNWYARANETGRQECPLSQLKVALQCGGSDAFSGVSGNPLAGRVAREVIRHGGAASLAETDELIGAEPYMLANTRNFEVARRFLDRIAVFRERIAWHGHSAEENPSGGNQFRGLYNISLKSIGAARKKSPDVRLDHVIDYAERMQHPGFHFMDSPGNDLESIAGQVASGCNLIFFITGNGSVTNFPFVPTIKLVTTSRRFRLLARDMDVNAGRYQDGERLEDLGQETFGYAVRIASGVPSVGERAGHSQVSIWRDWCQTNGTRLQSLQSACSPGGKPIPIAARGRPAFSFPLSSEKVGLILPTSLCSGQIALRIASELNAQPPGATHGLSRFVALPHTEGCGASSGENEEHYLRTVVGHLLHPMVGAALLLEHGCERTHNDLMRHTLKQYGVDPRRFGYASIQLHGGIEAVTARAIDWFAGWTGPVDATTGAYANAVSTQPVFSLGLTADGPVPENTARGLALLATEIVASGGSVVLPRSGTLTGNAAFLYQLGLYTTLPDTLAYGQVAGNPGLHVMATPTSHFVEALTGLGGTGVQVIVAHVAGFAMQGHPMIPTLQMTTHRSGESAFDADLDVVIASGATGAGRIRDRLSDRIRGTLTRAYVPGAWSRGHTDFQLTRGLLGVSL